MSFEKGQKVWCVNLIHYFIFKGTFRGLLSERGLFSKRYAHVDVDDTKTEIAISSIVNIDKIFLSEKEAQQFVLQEKLK